MARSVTKVINKRRVVNPRTGKARLKTISKEKVINSNVAKGSNTQGKPFKTDAARNRNLEIIENAKTERAKLAAKTAQVADITATAGQMVNSMNNAYQQSAAQRSTASPEVAQAVNGGLSPSGNSRDDDDESMDAYVG